MKERNQVPSRARKQLYLS